MPIVSRACREGDCSLCTGRAPHTIAQAFGSTTEWGECEHRCHERVYEEVCLDPEVTAEREAEPLHPDDNAFFAALKEHVCNNPAPKRREGTYTLAFEVESTHVDWCRQWVERQLRAVLHTPTLQVRILEDEQPTPRQQAAHRVNQERQPRRGGW